MRTRNYREGTIVARYLERHPEVAQQQLALARRLHERLGPLMVPDGASRFGPTNGRTAAAVLGLLPGDEQKEILAAFAGLGVTPSQWRADWKARERASTWRPITDEEIPFLESFGAGLRRFRKLAGLSQGRLGELAGCSLVHVEKLEAAVRRPSYDLVCSLAGVLSEQCPDLGDPAELVETMCSWLGPALPPESPFKFRVHGRRERRLQRKAKAEVAKIEQLAALQKQAEAMAREVVRPVLETESRRRAKAAEASRKRQQERETRLRHQERELREKEARLRQASENLAERAERLRQREREGQQGD